VTNSGASYPERSRRGFHQETRAGPDRIPETVDSGHREILRRKVIPLSVTPRQVRRNLPGFSTLNGGLPASFEIPEIVFPATGLFRSLERLQGFLVSPLSRQCLGKGGKDRRRGLSSFNFQVVPVLHLCFPEFSEEQFGVTEIQPRLPAMPGQSQALFQHGLGGIEATLLEIQPPQLQFHGSRKREELIGVFQNRKSLCMLSFFLGFQRVLHRLLSPEEPVVFQKLFRPRIPGTESPGLPIPLERTFRISGHQLPLALHQLFDTGFRRPFVEDQFKSAAPELLPRHTETPQRIGQNGVVVGIDPRALAEPGNRPRIKNPRGPEGFRITQTDPRQLFPDPIRESIQTPIPAGTALSTRENPMLVPAVQRQPVGTVGKDPGKSRKDRPEYLGREIHGEPGGHHTTGFKMLPPGPEMIERVQLRRALEAGIGRIVENQIVALLRTPEVVLRIREHRPEGRRLPRREEGPRLLDDLRVDLDQLEFLRLEQSSHLCRFAGSVADLEDLPRSAAVQEEGDGGLHDLGRPEIGGGTGDIHSVDGNHPVTRSHRKKRVEVPVRCQHRERINFKDRHGSPETFLYLNQPCVRLPVGEKPRKPECRPELRQKDERQKKGKSKQNFQSSRDGHEQGQYQEAEAEVQARQQEYGCRNPELRNQIETGGQRTKNISQCGSRIDPAQRGIRPAPSFDASTEGGQHRTHHQTRQEDDGRRHQQPSGKTPEKIDTALQGNPGKDGIEAGDQQESEDGSRGKQYLDSRKSLEMPGSRSDHQRKQGRTDTESRQEHGQHQTQGKNAALQDKHEDPEPQHLVGHRAETGRHGEPGQQRMYLRLRSRGFSLRHSALLPRHPIEKQRAERGQHIHDTAGKEGPAEPEMENSPRTGSRDAEYGSKAVETVEQAENPADLVLPADQCPGEKRQGCTHHGGRKQQQTKGQEPDFRRLQHASSGHAVGKTHHERREQGPEADQKFEEGITAERSPAAEFRLKKCSKPQSAHECRENGGCRGNTTAEEIEVQPGPRRLENQGGCPGKSEQAGGKENETTSLHQSIITRRPGPGETPLTVKVPMFCRECRENHSAEGKYTCQPVWCVVRLTDMETEHRCCRSRPRNRRALVFPYPIGLRLPGYVDLYPGLARMSRRIFGIGKFSFGSLLVGTSIFLVGLLVLWTVPARAGTCDFRLASSSAGEDGSLVLRAYYPDSTGDFRYGADGAPVVVISPGGWEGGSLALQGSEIFLQEGFVVLTFLFPGSGPPDLHSDGIYDERGDLCQQALRDCLLFATGEMRDSLGRNLDQIVGGMTRPDLVGILALSNGGSIAVTTLARYGDEIPPLAFLTGWESPTSDQVLGVEFGTHELDPDPLDDFDGDGVTDNDVLNGAFMSYDFPQCMMHYDRIRFDPDATVFSRGIPVAQGLFFFDNDGDGRYTTSNPATGSTDTNGNGALDPWEDYPLAGISHDLPGGGECRVLSRAATAAAEAVVSSWPSHYATAAESSSFWAIRDAAELFPAAMQAQPALAGMSLFSRRDHVQSSIFHEHVHHWVDGFLEAGHWHRLNPDRVYVEAVGNAAFPNVRDNDACLSPNPEDFAALAENPGDIRNSILYVAGIAEMADRAFYGVWDANLDQVIVSNSGGVETSHFVNIVINCHDWVNPEESADTISFILDTLDAAGLDGEFFLTAPLVEAWQVAAPELILRLRESGHTISYHVRPPHPVAFPYTRQQLNSRSLADFEIYHQDLSTGELDPSRPGGYLLVEDVFGRKPSATGMANSGTDLADRFARITAVHGARVGVFDHGPVPDVSGWDNLALPRDALYPRPNDFFVARVDSLGYPSPGGEYWWNRIASGELEGEQLAEAFRTGFLEQEASETAPVFSVIVIHEHDFYSDGTPWKPVYFEDPEGRIPKDPPFDLDATAPWVRHRSAEETTRIREAFADLVEAVAAFQAGVITSEDASVLGDSLFSPASEPMETVNWIENGDFESTSPTAYAWAENEDGGENGWFSITEDAAAAGRMGLHAETTGGIWSIGCRVDADKGQVYDFGAMVRITGDVHITLELQGVTNTHDGLLPVGAPFVTPPLNGPRDWTTLESTAALAANCDYLVLYLRVEGAGSIDLDNAFVSSTEDRTMVIPSETGGPLLVGSLIHVENVPELKEDSTYFRAKKQVLEDLAAIYHRHHAVLTIQSEMELFEGLQLLDPDFIHHLREEYQCAFSVHTHGPRGDNPSTGEILDYIGRRKAMMESMGTGPVRDLNGNFDVPDYSVFSRAGIYSMTAFKNTRTQTGYQGRYFHPWRPSEGNPYIDETAWAVDDPSSRVIYLPGACKTSSQFHRYIEMKILPGLTAALWNTDPEKPTTWYFITHVDFFQSREGIGLAQYMESENYQEDLKAYDDLLSEIFDPLRQRRMIIWAGPEEMRRAFEDWAGMHGGARETEGRSGR